MAGVEVDGLLVLVFDGRLILRDPVEIERPVVMGVVVGRVESTAWRKTSAASRCLFCLERLRPLRWSCSTKNGCACDTSCVIPCLGRVEERFGGSDKGGSIGEVVPRQVL